MPGVIVSIAEPQPTILRPSPLRGLGRGRRPLRRGGMSRWILGAVALAVVLAGAGVTTTVATAAPAAPVGPPVVACSGAKDVKLSDEQRRNAATIIATAQGMGAPPRASLVALATAMQESTLRNLDYGDRDSLGLFQQRPSQGWGTPAQVRDPVYATRKFVKWLLSIPGWEGLPVTVAAQKVQRSAFPNAYAKWEPLARALVDGTTCTTKK
jgi:peptidoglycan DL-endopeptidase CwlO